MEQKKTKRIIWICVAGVLALAVGLIVAQYIGLRPIVAVEAGDALPALREGDRYAQDYGTLAVGTHVVKVVHHGIPTPVLVRVRDTAAPTAEPRELTLAYGETAKPDKLISRIRDASVVSVSFEEPFDFDRIGDFDVTVALEDASGNRSTVASKMHIRATVDGVAREAGDPIPEAKAFLYKSAEAELLSTLSADMMHHIGTYPIEFRLANGQTAASTLTVSDTTPPQGESTTVWIRPGDPLSPEMLVKLPHDETDLTFAFLSEPDESLPEVQTVAVRMTDEAGNTADVESKLIVSRIEPIAIEASDEPLTADRLASRGEIVLDEPFVPNTTGIYTVNATVDGEADFVLVTVVDTTPPTVEKRGDAVLYTGHPAAPETAFAATDFSPVTFTWLTEPDWTTAGEQSVRVMARDGEGNETELSETVTVEDDVEPPVLYGVVDRIAYVGEPIAYLAEVYAEDAVDGKTEVTVESGVQADKAGTYEVTFITEDFSGNRASATCKYKLVSATVTEAEIHELAQEVLSRIITDDMVTAEKLKAVFDYTRGHVHYVGDSNKSDWRKEAARGFRTGRGDCFTFYSVTRALLDELGIEYMSVQRQGGRTRHYWTIVNIGTGWYHFDTTVAPHHKHKCFMWTNAQCKVKPYFWRYNESKYPEIATEKFDYNEVVRMEREGLLP